MHLFEQMDYLFAFLILSACMALLFVAAYAKGRIDQARKGDES